jgi:hypothetical protein
MQLDQRCVGKLFQFVSNLSYPKAISKREAQVSPRESSPMLVPLNTALAVLLVIPTLSTFTPGAKTSTAAPKFENEALISVLASIAPTVIADGVEAGDVVFASTYSLSALLFSQPITHCKFSRYHSPLQQQPSHQPSSPPQSPN